MKPKETILEIQHLLKLKKPHREISKEIGCSRGLIILVNKGIRLPIDAPLPEEKVNIFDLSKAKKCSICGAKVILPCVACAAREYQKKHSKKPDQDF
jgi:hypothetical protein